MAFLSLFIFTLLSTSLSRAQTVADDQEIFLPVSIDPKVNGVVDDKSLYFEDDKTESKTAAPLEDVLFQDEPGSGEEDIIPTTPRFVVHVTDGSHHSQPQTPQVTDDEDLDGSGEGSGDPSGVTPVLYYRITIFALNINYTSELEIGNYKSEAYQSVAIPLQISIDNLYVNTPGEQFATILQFIPLDGGVEVLFDLGSIGYFDDEDIEFVAKSAVQSGRIGNVTVDPLAFYFEKVGDIPVESTPIVTIPTTIVVYYRVSFIVINYPIPTGGLLEESAEYQQLKQEIFIEIDNIYRSLPGQQDITGLELFVENGVIRVSFDIVSVGFTDTVIVKQTLFSVISSGSLGNFQVEPESLRFITIGEETSSIIPGTTAQPPIPCRGDAQFICSNGDCVDSAKVCNGERDCPSGDDEVSCSCSRDDVFVCDTQQCILEILRCDGFRDCFDGSDEINCPTCKTFEFRCANGECRPDFERCDGKYDCADFSDEDTCALPPNVCGIDQFTCIRQFECIDNRFICDDYVDCTDGSDEDNCASPTVAPLPSTQVPPVVMPCRNGQSTCKDGGCIHASFICDGDRDCNDGSDEIGCEMRCEPNEFQCDNGFCALKIWRCDGDTDCSDGSDEVNCPTGSPDDPCNSQQFQCLRTLECIPKAYRCDDEIDCLDRSDEISCAKPVITVPPNPRKTYYVGDTITIYCEAEGIPFPYITWRLNWGNLPDSDRITTTSVRGKGTLTITDARKTDQGAYTCEATNSKDSVLAIPDAIIIVIDRGTDICASPLFNDAAETPSECIDCFCFGITSTCYSSGYYESVNTIPFDVEDDLFGVRLVRDNDGNLTEISRQFIQVFSDSGFIAGRELGRLPRGDYYWFLPSLFTGNQLTSYGMYLSYSFRYTYDDVTNFRDDVYDVIMKSGDIVLAYKDPVPAQAEAIIDRRILLREAGWVRLSVNPMDPNGPPKVTPVSRAEFMLVLQNIRDFQLQASYDYNTRDFILYAVSMGTSVNQLTGQARAFLVEDCQCPIGYMGLSCERCGQGYYRDASGNRYLGTCTECSDRCNQNSNDCHPETGACRNCQYNTAGDACDICADGFYGDPLNGIACRPCPCPLEVASNQFSRTCFLDTDGQPTCDRCPQGYEGRRCERCAKFFEGNPLEVGSSCGLQGTYCNTDGYSSIDINGNCICKENVEGDSCSTCKESTFYLANKNPKGCIACFCMGVSSECSSSSWSRESIYISFDQASENYDITLSDQNAVDTNANLVVRPGARELSFSSFGSLPRNTYYWNLPDAFTGNKLTSYGGNLRFSIAFSSAPDGRPVIEPDVVIVGNGFYLYHFSNISLTPGRLQSVSVPFYENAWRRADGSPVPRENFLMAITNLNFLLIRASYSTRMTETSVRDISLDVAYDFDTGRDLAYEVEQCVCPPGYEGLSCESCAPGFTRTGAGVYLGLCALCDCNGHSEECDPESGVCRNCRDNTVGPYCDRCATGYYSGLSSADCQPCPCPLGTSCGLNSNLVVVCTNCPTGTTGDFCESCAPGFQRNSGNECVPSSLCDCDLAGSESNACEPQRGDIPSILCPCKTYVTGDRCDRCEPSYYNLAESNPDGCLRCFCMGVTSDCTSAPSYYRERNDLTFPTPFNPAGVRLVNSDQSRTYDGPFSINVAENEIYYTGFQDLQVDTYYWKLPSRFLGNKLTSYGGQLRFTINYRIGSQGGIGSQDPEVLQLAGNDITLIHRTDRLVRRGETRIFEVQLVESSFVRPDGAQATREHIMMTLADLDTILIRASYHSGTVESRLRDVSMDTAGVEPTNFGLASEVERCYCPTGYIGLSCEDCADGYTRSGDGLYLGRCISCECNGHSEQCDPETGVCSNCRDNTFGDYCEYCKTGYYGDASIGCRRCACPLTESSNNFSPICELDSTSSLICTACPVGYEGTRCERCSEGYIGDPTVINGKCTLDQIGPAPIVDIRPSSVNGVESQSVTLRCYVTGSATVVVWSRADGRQLSSRAEQLPNNFLRIVDVQPEDSGEYICTAYNQQKTTSSSCVLTVVSPYIRVYVEEPRVLEKKIGETATFMCRGESKVSYTLAWMKEVGFLPTKADALPNGDLIIKNVDQSDEGVYACIGSNMFEMDKAMVSLRIIDGREPPQVRINPSYRQITEGETVDFVCSANGSPTPTLRWTRQGSSTLPSNALVSNGVLRIYSASVNNVGTYQCEASNAAGSQSAVARLDVIGIQLPTPDITPRSLQLNAGDRAEFTCIVTDPSATVEWSRAGGRPLPENAVQSGNVLYLQALRPEDSGEYVCTATNAAGYRYTTCNLQVKADFRVAPNATILRDNAVDNIITIQQGRPFVLQCYVTGNPQPTIQWESTSGLNSNHQVSPNGVFLTILNAQPEDRDYYSCIAENSVGYDRDYVHVEIERRSRPEIELFPEVQNMYSVGDSVQFQCRVVAGDPTPRVSWSFAEGTNPITAEIIDDVLRFRSLRPEDQGTYNCLAQSIAGSATISLTITLQGTLPQVSITPASPAEFQLGDEVLFECIGTGSPIPSIQWMKMDYGTQQYTRMASHEGMTLSSDYGSAMISITSISDADAGQYMCRAENAAGYAERELIVSVVPKKESGEVIVSPTELRVTQGETAQFSCTIEYATPGSYNVMWRRVGMDMPESHGINNGVLTIYNTQAEDAGEYYCIVEKTSGYSRFVVSLIVYAPPVVDVMPTSQTVVAGESIRIQCIAKEGTAPYTYRWEKEGGILPYTAITNDYGLLTIHFATANDTGRYVCTCSNSAGSSRGYSDINVLVPPAVTVVPFSLMRAIGSTVEFYCRVNAGSPLPRITWSKEDGSPLPDTASVVNNNLILSDLELEDQGTYVCQAENAAGRAQASGKLVLQAPPAVEITVHTAIQFVAIGESVTFECKASGDPTPTIQWTRVDAEIPFSAQIEGGMLTIPIVQLADAGTYRCIATNVVDSVDSQVILYVQAAPQAVIQPSSRTAAVGSVVVFTCLATGYPSPRISWSKLDGNLPANRVISRGVLTINQVVKEDAGVYVCTANNSQGAVEYTSELFVGGFVPYFQQMPLSFIEYPKLSNVHGEFEIDISFKPESTEGLILYSGQKNDGTGDFLSFGLLGGHAEFRFELGSGVAIIRSEAPLDLGVWHTVTLKRQDRSGQMLVHGQTEVFGESGGQFRGMDLQQNLYLGGVPTFGEIPRNVGLNTGFIGCVSQVVVDGEKIELAGDYLSMVGVTGCQVCEDNPCQNDAVCSESSTEVGYQCTCKPGFFGQNCEQAAEQCYAGACGVGECIAKSGVFGFTCKCPLGRTGERCETEFEISTPSFSDGSFISYPSLRPLSRSTLSIHMTFKPDTEEDGILLFNGQMQDGSGDYISIYIKDRRVVFQYDSGSKAAVITGTSEVNANQWHTLVAERNRRDGSLEVDDNEAIKGQSPIGSSGLDVPLRLFIGGVDNIRQIPSEISVTKSFKGCLAEIKISEIVYEVSDHVDSANVGDCTTRAPCHSNPCQNNGVCTPAGLDDYYCICGSGYQGKDCELLRGPCETLPCQNGGSCVTLGEEYKCLCSMDYTGPNCELVNSFLNAIDVSRDGYLALRSDLIPRNVHDQEQLRISFKTDTQNGMILWQGVEEGQSGRQRDFIALGIKDGYLVFMFQLGSGIANIEWPDFRVDDDVEHVAYIQRNGNQGFLSVDENERVTGQTQGENIRLDVPGPVYLGGAPDVARHTGGQFTMGIAGCISKLQIHSGEVNLQSEAVAGKNVGPCL